MLKRLTRRHLGYLGFLGLLGPVTLFTGNPAFLWFSLFGLFGLFALFEEGGNVTYSKRMRWGALMAAALVVLVGTLVVWVTGG